MSALRSVVAVVAGYFIFAVSAVVLFRVAARDPHTPQDPGFVLFAVAYGMVFALLGGVAAAAIAGRRPIVHACILAGIISLGAFISLSASPGEGAIWSQLAAIGVMAPCAVVGGLLRGRLLRKRKAAASEGQPRTGELGG